jgi:hypothetical protein
MFEPVPACSSSETGSGSNHKKSRSGYRQVVIGCSERVQGETRILSAIRVSLVTRLVMQSGHETKSGLSLNSVASGRPD